MNGTRLAGTLAVVAMLISGCVKTQTSLPQPPDQNPQAVTASDVEVRVRDLQARSGEYAAVAQRLPAKSEQENRELVTQEFGLLAQILPMLNGPDQTGDFQQQLRIIDSSRAQLAGGSMDLGSEPAIGTALRATWRALGVINQKLFTDVPDIAKALDTMQAKVNELDTVTGALHRLIAGQAIAASAEAITQMSNTLETRLVEKNKKAPKDTEKADPKQEEKKQEGKKDNKAEPKS